MRKLCLVFISAVFLLTTIITSCSKDEQLVSSEATNIQKSNLKAGSILPVVGNYKVAYYTFDAAGGVGPSMTTFTDLANVVIVFEGTLWELADTIHYNSGWMKNNHYKYKKEVLRDIKVLQSRGIKVLMNVDDAASWSTTTPFTTWDGVQYNYQQFAAFVKSCAIDIVGLDGISLDVEHGATDNTSYRNLITELGKYFGPLSTNSSTQIYTGAFYSGGAPGPIFREVALSQYLNFVMDMGYFTDNTYRFNYWANTLGASKVMIGVVNDQNSLSSAIAAAQWQPANPPKAGIMVYAANNSKSYTDQVFAALPPVSVTAPNPAANPSPASGSAGVSTAATISWTAGSGATSHNVYFGTTSTPASKGNQSSTTYNPGTLTANTTYYWRIDEVNSVGTTTGALWSFTTGSAATSAQVNLSSSFNLSNGITNDASTFASTSGLDGAGYAYSKNLLGTSVSWSGATFTIGAANTSDAVTSSGQSITLPSGKYSSIKVLGSAVNGSQASQTFVVTYSDNTTATFTQSISDWCGSQNYAGETKAVTMTYRNRYTGAKHTIGCYVYGYSFALNNTKTVSSIKLPGNSKVKVLAMTLVP